LKTNVLILPGIGNSGPAHWQSLWQMAHPSFRRVMQRDWDCPVCSEWIETLEQAISEAGPQTVLVAHSLACLLVARWAATTMFNIRGALLVAIPDPKSATFPEDAVGFFPVPLTPLPFPSIVVASTNDPFGSFSYAQECARHWGSRFVNSGAAGHINASSGLGEWPAGFELLREMIDT
jgi:predicted alpha/beta hydrolase family esterase